jgi:broad specificity phosphatase PhoE
MIILLFRHGHKVFSVDNDPPLSPKGFEQAQHLNQLIAENKIPLATHCWVSDKKRTLQTLEKAIEQHQMITHKKSDLNYREGDENTAQFRSRIQKFLRELSARAKESEIHYICTHYDWIEEAMTLIDCDKDLRSYEYASWSPGQYLVFDLVDQNTYKLLNKGVL